MVDNELRVSGAKNALLNSLMFYRQALLQEGYIDINKEIATEVGKAMILSEEQIEFIEKSSKPKAKEILENSKFLLKHMAFKNTIDKDSIVLILEGLNTLETLIKNK